MSELATNPFVHSDVHSDVFSDTNPTREYDHEATYNELRSLFEMDTVTSERPPNSLFGVSVRNYIAEFLAHEDISDPNVQRHAVLATTTAMCSAIGIVGANQNYDLSTRYNAILDRLEEYDKHADVNDSLQVATMYFAYQLLPIVAAYRPGVREHIRELQEVEHTSDDEVQLAAVKTAVAHEKGFFCKAARTLDYTQKCTLAGVNTLMQEDVAALLDATQQEPIPTHEELADLEENTQELDFVVLPEGTELRELHDDILKDTAPHMRPYVDFSRLQLLKDMRDIVGKEKCRYARGKPKNRNFVVPETGEVIDESYAILVMQDRDDDGLVVGENIIAISPVARRHAAFVYRHDVSEGLPWQEILKFPKQDVGLLGVRRVKFSHSKDQPLHEAMLKKFTALLTCDKTKFEGALRRKEDGSYILRRSLGDAALKHKIMD